MMNDVPCIVPEITTLDFPGLFIKGQGISVSELEFRDFDFHVMSLLTKVDYLLFYLSTLSFLLCG